MHRVLIKFYKNSMQSKSNLTSKLAGQTIMVTRPVEQAQPLIELIESYSGSVYPFPVLEIVPLEDDSAAQTLFKNLEQFDIAIFISANAVRIGLSSIEHLPTSLQLAAVGKATARALQAIGLNADIMPQHRFDSEGLLDTPALTNVSGKKIIIIRGEGGRELLATTLRERGAEVSYAETYRRVIPKRDPLPLIDKLKQESISAIVVTSGQSLDNLIQIVSETDENQIELLLQQQLIVISQRTAEIALERGFKQKPLLAEEPTDAAIVEELLRFTSDLK